MSVLPFRRGGGGEKRDEEARGKKAKREVGKQGKEGVSLSVSFVTTTALQASSSSSEGCGLTYLGRRGRRGGGVGVCHPRVFRHAELLAEPAPLLRLVAGPGLSECASPGCVGDFASVTLYPGGSGF